MQKKYNFDKIIKRNEHLSKKWTDWSCLAHEKIDPEVLPMWIADMEFQVAEEIISELQKTLDYRVLGYDAPCCTFFEPFINWQKNKFNWNLEKKYFSCTPGVVPGIASAINTFTEKGDKILIQPPVYYPFFKVIEENKRTLVENNLIIKDDMYQIDFSDFEKKLSESKMFILCSPHNPVGRVWQKEELLEISRLCIKYDVILVSDEIHSDLCIRSNKHYPIASISSDDLKVITFMAPSKSFNVAGLAQSVAIIKNPKLKELFDNQLAATGLMHMASFGITGFKASYKYGEKWLEEALEYIEKNADFVEDYLRKNIPEIVFYKLQGTFLMWLDFSKFNLKTEELDKLLFEKGKILLEPGIKFGSPGKNHYRLNIACPRTMLEDALSRIKTAIS